MKTLIRQRSRGFWAALPVAIVTGAVLSGMFRPQFTLADADTNNGDKFAQLTAQVEQLSVALGDTQQALKEALAAVDALQTDLDTVEGKLQNVHVVGNDVIFEGVNVVVQSGSGATDGPVNGTGNLIIGYDEGSFENKTGAHNLIVGAGHTYTSYGSFVAGWFNTVSGPYSSVSGGTENQAVNRLSSIGGGAFNYAHGDASFIAGGNLNATTGYCSTVSGGGGNWADADYSTVSGGLLNQAHGGHSSVSGGSRRTAFDDDDWVAGSLLEDN